MHLAARYGDPNLTVSAPNPVLDVQLRHRSVRAFTDAAVTDAQLELIVAAAQSASTSSNLQPVSVVAVRDRERKQRLSSLAGNQAFIVAAPIFLVWIADLGRHRRMAARAERPLDGADYLETTLVAFIDTALAAQNAVIAAESLGLGATFVGGIRNQPEAVAAELTLPPHVIATFGLAIGTHDPSEPADVKPRLPQSAVLHHERFDAEAADAQLPVYDERLAAYNARFGLTGGWSERVLARLAGAESLGTRHAMRATLERLGLPSR